MAEQHISTIRSPQRRRRALSARPWLLACGLVLASLVMPPGRASADVGVVLGETLDLGAERITGSGHSAVYLSRICPASPVKMRLCLPGESGSVLSSYQSLDEDHPYDWNIAPFNIFVYGVDDPQNRPLFATEALKSVLEENYRRTYLSKICTNNDCITNRDANWRYMVGSTLDRGLYIFVVHTTLEQDLALIERFNSQPNESHFNGATNNCADFTRNVINSYFPHAAHRDFINDFGMTSPKAVARTFARYAKHHPDAEYRVLHFSQVPGTIKRSTDVRAGTEQIYRSKKWLVPMLALASHELPFFAASYMLTGRFNPQREAEQYPTVEATQIKHELNAAKSGDDSERVQELQAARDDEFARAVGTPKQWNHYRKEFRTVLLDAVGNEVIPSEQAVDRLFRYLDQAGKPVLDEHGALWIEIRATGDNAAMELGVSPSNLFAPDSDSLLAYELILAHVRGELRSPAHCRESMPQFTAVWDLLISAHERSLTFAFAHHAGETGQPGSEPAAAKASFIQHGEDF